MAPIKLSQPRARSKKHSRFAAKSPNAKSGGGLKRPLGRLCGMAALAMQGARAGRGVDAGGPLWPWEAPWVLGKSLNPHRAALGA